MRVRKQTPAEEAHGEGEQEHGGVLTQEDVLGLEATPVSDDMWQRHPCRAELPWRVIESCVLVLCDKDVDRAP